MTFSIDAGAGALIRLLLLNLLTWSAVGQPIDNKIATDTSTTNPERTLQFSYSYMNPVSYRGRTFGVHQFGMMPQVTYQTPTNWHLYSVGYIWNNFQTSEFGKIDLGVEKEGALGKHLTYTVGYEHWFFPGSDADERQPINNFLEAYLAGDWHDWSPAIGNYYMVGTEQLLQTDLTLSRYLGLVEGRHWSLFAEPLVNVMLSNQSSLIDGVYQAQVDKRNPPVMSVPSFRRPYGLVAAEINCPITLQQLRWSLLVDPRLVKPFNTLPGERTKPFFYAVVTLTHTIHLAHGH